VRVDCDGRSGSAVVSSSGRSSARVVAMRAAPVWHRAPRGATLHPRRRLEEAALQAAQPRAFPSGWTCCVAWCVRGRTAWRPRRRRTGPGAPLRAVGGIRPRAALCLRPVGR